MPVGKKLGSFKGEFTSVRTVSVNGDERVVAPFFTPAD